MSPMLQIVSAQSERCRVFFIWHTQATYRSIHSCPRLGSLRPSALHRCQQLSPPARSCVVSHRLRHIRYGMASSLQMSWWSCCGNKCSLQNAKILSYRSRRYQLICPQDRTQACDQHWSGHPGVKPRPNDRWGTPVWGSRRTYEIPHLAYVRGGLWYMKLQGFLMINMALRAPHDHDERHACLMIC